MLDFILVTFGLTWLLLGSFFDLATREVPDWISYSMIALGLTFRLIASIATKDIWPIVYGLLGFGIFFIVGCFMYYTKQWGGGDAKLLMGIGAVFATPFFGQTHTWPYWIVLLVNIIICGAIYALVWIDILAFQHFKAVLKDMHEQSYTDVLATFSIGLCATVLSVLFLPKIFTTFILISTLLLIFAASILHYAKAVERIALTKKIPLSKLTLGDWISKDIKVGKKILVKKEGLGITKEDLKKLKKYKVKQVWVRYGIPFAPALFLGVAFTLVTGDLTALLR